MNYVIIGLITVFIVFLGIGIFNANELKKIKIIKTVLIKGNVKEVFDMVKYLNNFPKWSPFLVQDPTQRFEVKGNDGTVNAQYHWEGNNGKDLGFQEIVQIDEPKYIGLKCDIKKPFEANPTFDYYFNETPKGVEVKQVFNLESSLIDSFFMWIFGAKSEMEKTNELGLDLLKKAVEKQ